MRRWDILISNFKMTKLAVFGKVNQAKMNIYDVTNLAK